MNKKEAEENFDKCQELINMRFEIIGKLKELEKEENNVNDNIEKHKD